MAAVVGIRKYRWQRPGDVSLLATAFLNPGSFAQTRNSKDDDELLDQCKELTKAWKDFHKSSVFKKAKFPDVNETKPPSIETLQATVKETQLRWGKERETRWGVAKANLVAFAEKLNAHKALFSFFPSENIYTSVLCGTISTFLTVCSPSPC